MYKTRIDLQQTIDDLENQIVALKESEQGAFSLLKQSVEREEHAKFMLELEKERTRKELHEKWSLEKRVEDLKEHISDMRQLLQLSKEKNDNRRSNESSNEVE